MMKADSASAAAATARNRVAEARKQFATRTRAKSARPASTPAPSSASGTAPGSPATPHRPKRNSAPPSPAKSPAVRARQDPRRSGLAAIPDVNAAAAAAAGGAGHLGTPTASPRRPKTAGAATTSSSGDRRQQQGDDDADPAAAAVTMRPKTAGASPRRASRPPSTLSSKQERIAAVRAEYAQKQRAAKHLRSNSSGGAGTTAATGTTATGRSSSRKPSGRSPNRPTSSGAKAMGRAVSGSKIPKASRPVSIASDATSVTSAEGSTADSTAAAGVPTITTTAPAPAPPQAAALALAEEEEDVEYDTLETDSVDYDIVEDIVPQLRPTSAPSPRRPLPQPDPEYLQPRTLLPPVEEPDYVDIDELQSDSAPSVAPTGYEGDDLVLYEEIDDGSSSAAHEELAEAADAAAAAAAVVDVVEPAPVVYRKAKGKGKGKGPPPMPGAATAPAPSSGDRPRRASSAAAAPAPTAAATTAAVEVDAAAVAAVPRRPKKNRRREKKGTRSQSPTKSPTKGPPPRQTTSQPPPDFRPSSVMYEELDTLPWAKAAAAATAAGPGAGSPAAGGAPAGTPVPPSPQRRKPPRVPPTRTPTVHLEEAATPDPTAEPPARLELSRDALTFTDRVLGRGFFGEVVEARLNVGDGDTRVAVKRLREGLDKSGKEVASFRAEVKLMCDLHDIPHENVLALHGFLLASEPNLLVMEYCGLGDLLGVLRRSQQQDAAAAAAAAAAGHEAGAVPEPGEAPSSPLGIVLTEAVLISFGKQVADGMAHLSKHNVLHRDLAARNVLVTNQYVAKVSDYGLARSVRQDSIYTSSKDGRLAFKWMSYECLTTGQVTSVSDVWSFGVLLWEIMTKGDRPYATVKAHDLVAYLEAGFRLEPPEGCPEAVASIMASCFSLEPSARPPFQAISEQLAELISASNHRQPERARTSTNSFARLMHRAARVAHFKGRSPRAGKKHGVKQLMKQVSGHRLLDPMVHGHLLKKISGGLLTVEQLTDLVSEYEERLIAYPEDSESTAASAEALFDSFMARRVTIPDLAVVQESSEA